MSKKLSEKLYSDLVKGIKSEFSNFDITIQEEDKDVLVSYMNWKRRFIDKKKRKVIYSKEIKKNPKYSIYKKSIDKIAHKFQTGADLTPFLSKGIVDNPYKKDSRKDKDIFLNAFGIHHLHLLNAYEDKKKFGIRFVKRHDDLLYIFIKESNVFLLDIDRHNFGNLNLFRIIKNNWEYLISSYELKGFETNNENLTDEMASKLMKNGISISIELDEKVYALCSLTMSGHNGNWMFDFYSIKEKIKELSFNLAYDINLLKKEINLLHNKFIDKLEYALLVKDGYVYLIEENSNSTIYLNNLTNKWEIYQGVSIYQKHLINFNY